MLYEVITGTTINPAISSHSAKANAVVTNGASSNGTALAPSVVARLVQNA